MKECSERVSDLTEITQHGSGRSRLEPKQAGSQSTGPQLLSCLAVTSVDRQSLQGSPQPPFPGVCFEARPPSSIEERVSLVIWVPEERRGHLWQSEEIPPPPSDRLVCGVWIVRAGLCLN